MVIEITIAFNQSGVLNAVALEVETGSNLTYILATVLAWQISLMMLSKGNEIILGGHKFDITAAHMFGS